MQHVVVGAGPAGVIAAETLRKVDPSAEITLISDEPEPPYSRMAIPYYLVGNIGEDGTYLRKDEGHYDRLNIRLLQARVGKVIPGEKTLSLENGDTLSYNSLLVATGARPALPPIPGVDLPGVHACWTLEDGRNIARLAGEGSRVVLIGAGFIGGIILEALATRGVRLTVVEIAERMVPRMMDETAGRMIKERCESRGVRVLISTQVSAIENGREGHPLTLNLSDGQTLEAELVICATGVTSNMELVADSGVETDQGILVDRLLQTNVPGVFAAGDVAQGRDFSTGGNMVHAIQPTASEHGRVAALNMAGLEARYHGSLMMNVLNTLGLISFSFGQWSGVAGGESAEALDEKNHKYLRLEFDGDRLVGALGIDLPQHVGILRGLIQSRTDLSSWKAKLLGDPNRVVEAYLACTQG